MTAPGRTPSPGEQRFPCLPSLGEHCGRCHRCTDPAPLPLHRTEAGFPRCSTCDGGGCPDCTDPA